MIREPSGDNALDLAAKRLERALAALEQRLARPGVAAGGLFDQDPSGLAAELAAARARERELEEAGQAASEALGRAIAEIRAALADQGEPAQAQEG